MVQSFKMRRVKRILRRSAIVFFSVAFLIISGTVFFKNYHYRLINRVYTGFISTSSLLDFRLKKINVYGCAALDPKEVYNALPYKINAPLFTYNVEALKEHVEKILLVKYVSVHKRYPHEIDILIKERTPIAQCSYKGQYALIDDQGVLYAFNKNADQLLPVVEGGREVSKLFPHVAEILSRFPDVKKQIQIYQLVKNRRWNLILKNGTTLFLPQLSIDEALMNYQKMKNKNYRNIDLRVPGYIFLKENVALSSLAQSETVATEKQN